MFYGLRRICCAALMALVAGQALPAFAEPTRLSPAELRFVATQEARAGNSGRALAMAEALILRDETDIDAWLIKARAARDIGDYPLARTAARRAWSLADSDAERYAASLSMAQALSSSQRRTAAQFWLRRAGEYAPTPALKARAVEDFRYVKSRNPWSTALSFNIAPTSNLNNGASTETVQLLGLPFDFTLQGAARALSGTEVSAGISSRYTLSESQTQQTFLTGGLFHRTYRLSDAAKRIAPDAEGRDFALTQLSFGIGQSFVQPQARLGFGWSLTAGRTLYGGDPLQQSLTLAVTARQVMDARNALNSSLRHEWQQGFGTRADARILSGTLGWSTLLGRDRLSLNLTGTQSTSDASYLDFEDTRLSARYRLGRPIWNTSIEFGVSASQRHYDVTPYAAGPREDTSLSADVTMVFNTLEYLGFVPSVTLKTRRTDSNVKLFDANETGLQLGVRSSF